jgi:ACT domain-containing protein
MRAVISVIGKDQKGIIAKISACLYDFNANIEDINQTIMQNNFTMVMLVDLSNAKAGIVELSSILEELGSKIDLSIRVQNEMIFEAMHRI